MFLIHFLPLNIFRLFWCHHIIKSDPDLEGSDTLSCVLVEDELSEQISFLRSETNINSNMEKKLQNEKRYSTVPEKTVCDKELNLNTKKSLLNNFKQFGCSQKTLEDFASTYSVNSQMALDFVYQECDSLSFNNVTEWLKYFQVMGGPKGCNYEAAIIVNGIANNECHPDPELIDGVDLKAIYRFISYALLGLPQEQLNEASAKFLSDEFQYLIDEANTDEADIDVRNMKRKIEDSLDNNSDSKIVSESLSLDPLNIAGWSFNSANNGS